VEGDPRGAPDGSPHEVLHAHVRAEHAAVADGGSLAVGAVSA
jgi:hypothetical protein